MLELKLQGEIVYTFCIKVLNNIFLPPSASDFFT